MTGTEPPVFFTSTPPKFPSKNGNYPYQDPVSYRIIPGTRLEHTIMNTRTSFQEPSMTPINRRSRTQLPEIVAPGSAGSAASDITGATRTSTAGRSGTTAASLSSSTTTSATNSGTASLAFPAGEFDEYHAVVLSQIEEDEHGGNGGDSDVEGNEFDIHNDAINHSTEEIPEYECVEPEDKDRKGLTTGIARLTATGGTAVIGEVSLDGSSNPNSTSTSPYSNIKIPSAPNDWKVPTVQTAKGEPDFDSVDNPGEWPRYCYRPVFVKGGKDAGKYKHHQLPTGARPVPADGEGKREMNGWKFHYKGWESTENKYRHGATTANLFPKEMEGCLDAEVLKELGLTKKRMEHCDALFFLQLILPLCDPSRSGVDNDPRKPYYTEVEKFTNMGKAESGYGGSYGHTWKASTACDQAKFDGALIHDGVLGGSNGAIYRRWDPDNVCFSKHISEGLSATRFCELKRAKKLCHNGSSPKRGQPGYDPAYKFTLIYDTIVHNTNAITKYADENQVIDESTWGHGGYGEAGSGLTGRLLNKPKAKGGQVVIITDVGRRRPRAFMHRHKLHERAFTREGPSELHDLGSKVLDMVIESDVASATNASNTTTYTKKIFRKKPCITVDNYFINDGVLEWAGKAGLGVIGTNRRDLLPAGIKNEYLQKIPTNATMKHAKAARFTQPIVAVKDYPEGYQRVHVSFQSTSSCNIASVNALNECSMFVELRERGRGLNKRYWAIEMNHARRLYLSTYHGIDVIDHLIKNAAIFYCTWKYWHAPVNHAVSLAIVVAYDAYKECCEGVIDQEWKTEPVDFFKFRSICSIQMLRYHPGRMQYPGDNQMRAVTIVPRKKRKNSEKAQVTEQQFKKAKRSKNTRLCGDMDKLCHHVSKIITIKKPRKCAWCGIEAYSVCTVCKDESSKEVALHYNSKKGEAAGEMCFYHWHNDNKFGLGKNDCSQLLQGTKKNWKKPVASDIKDNKVHIESIKERDNAN